jgi:hypothetical protein
VTEIKNKKIAIIGTSPIMILLYFRLMKNNSIDVFENSNLGGAWRIDKINGQKYTTHNNVIVALKKNEEKYINLINKELENLGCTKIRPSGIYETLSNYNHKNLFIHDLSGLYVTFKKRCNSLIKKKVSKLKAYKKKVYLNGIEYDHVYLPSCFDIKKINLDNENINSVSNLSISHHLTVLYDKIKVPNISYTENFDNVFDRAYFKKDNKKIIFTGRVRRKYKKFKPNKLIEASNLLQKLKNYVVRLKLNKYHHYIIDDNILDNLKYKFNKTNIFLIETRQFVYSYKLLIKLLK